MTRKRRTKYETKRIHLQNSDVRVVVFLYGNPLDLAEPERSAFFAVVDALIALETVGRATSTEETAEETTS